MYGILLQVDQHPQKNYLATSLQDIQRFVFCTRYKSSLLASTVCFQSVFPGNLSKLKKDIIAGKHLNWN